MEWKSEGCRGSGVSCCERVVEWREWRDWSTVNVPKGRGGRRGRGEDEEWVKRREREKEREEGSERVKYRTCHCSSPTPILGKHHRHAVPLSSCLLLRSKKKKKATRADGVSEARKVSPLCLSFTLTQRDRERERERSRERWMDGVEHKQTEDEGRREWQCSAQPMRQCKKNMQKKKLQLHWGREMIANRVF